MIGYARVSWFSLDKKFGFVSLGGTAADAFLHLSVAQERGLCFGPSRNQHAGQGGDGSGPSAGRGGLERGHQHRFGR